MGEVIEETTREGEVAGSNPAGRVARDFTQKKYVTFFGNPFPLAVVLTEPLVVVNPTGGFEKRQ
jgi:hypothetical protein